MKTRPISILALCGVIALASCTPTTTTSSSDNSDIYTYAVVGLLATAAIVGATSGSSDYYLPPSPSSASSSSPRSTSTSASASSSSAASNSSSVGSTDTSGTSASSSSGRQVSRGESAGFCVMNVPRPTTSTSGWRVANQCGYKVNWSGFHEDGSVANGGVGPGGEQTTLGYVDPLYACKAPSYPVNVSRVGFYECSLDFSR